MPSEFIKSAAKVALFTEKSLCDLPSFGSRIDGAGGHFAGIAPAPDGSGGLHILVLGPEGDIPMSWHDAMDFATSLEIDGHHDFSLPTKAEQAILFGSVGSDFSRNWYWSCTQRAVSADYAWYQSFGSGYQYYNRKHYEFRARALRRLIIR